MNRSTRNPELRTAFVTGATGLLGNNLTRLLIEQGVRVRALARSAEKARTQFGNLPVEIVIGDMEHPRGFAAALQGVDAIFHTAAYFRDSYKGGTHWDELHRTNVLGTAALLKESYAAGVRRFVHTSSVAVLHGPVGTLIDEALLRREEDADDYRSKIPRGPRNRAVSGCASGLLGGDGIAGLAARTGRSRTDFCRTVCPGFRQRQASRNCSRDLFRCRRP